MTSVKIHGFCAALYSCIVSFMLLQSSDAAVRFTNIPDDNVYVVKGQTARFTWDYHVDNINTEFDSMSPRWYFYNYSSMIGYADRYDGRKFRIYERTCPARLRTPTVRVSMEGKATLVITNVTLADSGTYVCTLFLLSGSLSSMPTSKALLIVTDTPKFTSKPKPNAIVIENSDLDSTCTAVGTPTPNVTWVHVIRGVTLSKGLGTAKLRLQNINRTQSGPYECHAINNPNERPVVAKTMVTVYYKPTVEKASSTVNISSWAGNTIRLRCKWSSSLPSPSWTWYKPNGDRITNISSIGRGSEVTVVTGHDNDDYGTYTCKATNIAGSDQHNISVTRLFPPSPPQVIEVVGIQSSSVMIIWTRPVDNGGSPVANYKLLIDSKILYVNSSSTLAYKEISGLKDGKTYNVTVLSGNIAGYGLGSSKVFKTTKHGAKSKSLQCNDTTTVGVLAAFFTISLIAIFILLAFIFWKHRRRNPQNTKQEQKSDAVYANAGAIGMAIASSHSTHSSHEMPVYEVTRNSNQEHYQQLNPATLQNPTATVPTYEPLRTKNIIG